MINNLTVKDPLDRIIVVLYGKASMLTKEFQWMVIGRAYKKQTKNKDSIITFYVRIVRHLKMVS